MTWDPMATLKGPKGDGLVNPRLVGDDLVVDVVDGTEVTGSVTVGSVRGATGPRGIQGLRGEVGPAPDMTVVVERLPAGSEPTVWQSGTDEEPTITLGIPDGQRGSVGPAGPTPAIQFSATALPEGSVPTITRIGGSDESPEVRLGIPAGQTGEHGPSPTLIFEQPLNLAPGSQPLVNVTQPRPGEYRLQLGLVQGPAGTASESIRDDQVSTATAWSSQKIRDEIDAAEPGWADITDKPSTFPPAAHEHGWGEVTGKPSTFPPAAHSHTWDSVTDKPATFPPAAHSHAWSGITGKPSTFQPSAHGHVATDVESARIPDVDVEVAAADYAVRSRVGATPGMSPLLDKLRSSILNAGERCVVAVVGDSIPRAQESALDIGFAERLAFRAGASAFPMLDSLSSRPSSGMTWLQGAQGGTVVANYLPEARLVKLALADPDYVLHGIACSDYYNQRPLAQVQADLRARFNRIEADSPGVVNIFLHVYARPDAQGKAISWQQYGAAIKAVIDEKPGSRLYVSVDDLIDLYDSGRSGNRFGLTQADGVHPSHEGHKLHADVIGAALGIPDDGARVAKLHSVLVNSSNITVSSNQKLTELDLGVRSYPRLIDVQIGIMFNPSLGSNGWFEIQGQMIRAGSASDFSQRFATSTNWQSTLLRRQFYLAPGASGIVRVNARVSGSGTSVVLQGGWTYSTLQVEEKPY